VHVSPVTPQPLIPFIRILNSVSFGTHPYRNSSPDILEIGVAGILHRCGLMCCEGVVTERSGELEGRDVVFCCRR
jgi:hypothetical protein